MRSQPTRRTIAASATPSSLTTSAWSAVAPTHLAASDPAGSKAMPCITARIPARQPEGSASAGCRARCVPPGTTPALTRAERRSQRLAGTVVRPIAGHRSDPTAPLSRRLHALSAGLTQLTRPQTVVGEVRFPFGPFLRIEVIESADHRRPGHRAIARVVLIRTQCPSDRLLGGMCGILGRLDDG